MTYPEPLDRGDHFFRKWWIRYSGAIAFFLVVIVGGLGLLQLETQATSTRNGLIESCKDNNVNKELEVRSLEQRIIVAREFDPRVLVPDINIYAYNNIIGVSIQTDKERIAGLQQTDCEARYPESGPLDFL